MRTSAQTATPTRMTPDAISHRGGPVLLGKDAGLRGRGRGDGGRAIGAILVFARGLQRGKQAQSGVRPGAFDRGNAGRHVSRARAGAGIRSTRSG